MSAPEELLCSRKWRLMQSWWMLFGWFPLAVAAWIGYLIIGVRAKNWKWLLIGAALFAWIVAMFTLIPTVPKDAPAPDTPEMAFWALSSIVVWFGNAIGLQWFINRQWLVWRAHHDKRLPWYASATQGTRIIDIPTPQSLTTIDRAFTSLPAAPAPLSATSGPVAPAVPPPSAVLQTHAATATAPVVLLNVNSATSEQFASLPGFDARTAEQIISARDHLGGFRDLAELVSVAGVKPHIFAAIRGRVTLGATSTVRPAQQANSTRPPNGRRLDF